MTIVMIAVLRKVICCPPKVAAHESSECLPLLRLQEVDHRGRRAPAAKPPPKVDLSITKPPRARAWSGARRRQIVRGFYALKLASICPHIDPAKVASVALRRRQCFFDPSSKPPRLVVIAECDRTNPPSATFRSLRRTAEWT